jgi:hypothetical protein
VVRFPVRRHFFGMTVPALLDQGKLPLIARCRRSHVFQMALETGGCSHIAVFEKLFPMNAGFIDLKFLRMAL